MDIPFLENPYLVFLLVISTCIVPYYNEILTCLRNGIHKPALNQICLTSRKLLLEEDDLVLFIVLLCIIYGLALGKSPTVTLGCY